MSLESGCALIARFEGCRLHAYQDRGGKWTIGYGCTGALSDGRVVGPGLTITQGEAAAELKARAARERHILEAMLEVSVTEHQKDALGSFCWNEGLPAFEHSTMRKLLNAGNYCAAADELPKWDKMHVDGALVFDQGLHNRRVAERALFLRT